MTMFAEIADAVDQPSVPLNVVLTPPLSLEATSGYGQGDKLQQNIVTRVWNLFKSMKPGADLTTFQLPPQFNLPKSQLQLYGESVYCHSHDLLSKCVEGESPAERFNAVVAWSISTTRPLIGGKAPYNPILGETHHVSSGNLNVLLEQVSHHPPVSALHATDETRKLELNWWQRPVPRFYGRSIEATVFGKRELKLLEFNETYEMNSPKLCLRLFPIPSTEWSGDVLIQCKQTGLRATLCFKGKSLLGFKGSSTRITGRIGHSSHGGDLFELQGNWDESITMKELSTGKISVLYDAKAVISNMKAPVLQNPEGVASTESAVVWSEVSESIMKGDWNKARESKRSVEEKHRKGESRWRAKHFTLHDSGDWVYLHRPQCVPPAPIIMPQSPQS